MKITRLEAIMYNQMFNDEKKAEFEGLGADTGGHYTREQINYAIDIASDSGIRATSRILGIPRRTLQRWHRKYGIEIKQCPSWVYYWAARRRKRREFWARRGY